MELQKPTLYPAPKVYPNRAHVANYLLLRLLECEIQEIEQLIAQEEAIDESLKDQRMEIARIRKQETAQVGGKRNANSRNVPMTDGRKSR